MEPLNEILPRIITSDKFLASYLLCQGFKLDKVVQNDRKRIAFVFEGAEVKDYKQAYKGGPVSVDMYSFRENFYRIRSYVNEKRRASCPNPSRMQLLKV